MEGVLSCPQVSWSSQPPQQTEGPKGCCSSQLQNSRIPKGKAWLLTIPTDIVWEAQVSPCLSLAVAQL